MWGAYTTYTQTMSTYFESACNSACFCNSEPVDVTAFNDANPFFGPEHAEFQLLLSAEAAAKEAAAEKKSSCLERSLQSRYDAVLAVYMTQLNREELEFLMK